MYGGVPYAGGPYAGEMMDAADVPVDTEVTLAVEVSFTTDALAEPAWVDVTEDVRSWDVQRGRTRELERMQPGRATVVLGNLSRQYDSLYDAGPWFGNLRPMRRMRIRETFSGVTYPTFDGYLDRIHLDYPDKGKDATATFTATDGFKILARTDLGRSVYANEVATDAPALWWHLDEGIDKLKEGKALNAAVSGATRDGTFTASPRVGGQTIVVNDPGAAMETESLWAERPGVVKQGVSLANANMDLLANAAFSVEMWIRLDIGTNALGVLWAVGTTASDTIHAIAGYTDDLGDGATSRIEFFIVASGGAAFYGVKTPNQSIKPGELHHVVCVVEASGQMALYLDGTRHVTAVAGAAGTSVSGVTRIAGGDFFVAYDPRPSNSAANNWHGATDEVAVYFSDLGQTRVSAHNTAGTNPWRFDLPVGRLRRILDLAEWPATLRELDGGDQALQAAHIEGINALDHGQKVAETEYTSLFFVDRAGSVRFDDRTAVFAREPYPVAFGDANDGTEVGYTAFTPDDGDEVIRNRATISRLTGTAMKSEAASSVDEFGRFDYTLEGLLHQTDTFSQDYANFVVSEYQSPRRRITALSVGPPIVGQEALVYPAMLGRELGDAITVRSRPQGGGDVFEQVCAIEGIRRSGAPGGLTSATLVLSPEFGIRALEDEDVATLGYAQAVVDQGGITTETDLTNLSVAVTVGSGRRVRVTMDLWLQSTVANDVAAGKIAEGAAILQFGQVTCDLANVPGICHRHVVLTPSSGSHTYKLRLARAAGTGTMTSRGDATFPASILVEDIGPA